jgi:hypothetical protein
MKMKWFDINRCKLIIFFATSTTVFVSVAAYCFWKCRRNCKNKKVARTTGQDNSAGQGNFKST